MCFNPSIINEHAHLPDKQRGIPSLKTSKKLTLCTLFGLPTPFSDFFHVFLLAPNPRFNLRGKFLKLATSMQALYT